MFCWRTCGNRATFVRQDGSYHQTAVAGVAMIGAVAIYVFASVAARTTAWLDIKTLYAAHRHCGCIRGNLTGFFWCLHYTARASTLPVPFPHVQTLCSRAQRVWFL